MDLENISSDIMDKVTTEMNSYDYNSFSDEDINEALNKDYLSIKDFQALLSPKAINYLEEMKEFNNIEDFLKKDIVLEIEDKTDKRNIEIKDRIKKLPLKNIEKLDSEKQKQIDNLVHQIEELLKEQK